jgi:hypothetical protein
MRSSMSTTTSQQARRDPVGGSAHVPRSRFVRHLWALAVVAAVLVGGNEIMKASRSPGDVIRSELVAAAAELAAPVGAYPNETATRAIRRHFRAHPATLETEFWPQVSVMLHHLDKTTCAIDRPRLRRRFHPAWGDADRLSRDGRRTIVAHHTDGRR